MKKLTVFVVLLVLCVLLAIWSPWANLHLNIGSIFGIKQAEEISGLQVYSLSGKVNVYLDENLVGSVDEGVLPLIKDDVTPGEHLITLKKDSTIENAYWEFGKLVNFYKGTTVIASYNLGPDEDFSEGHVIYATANSDSTNTMNLNLLSNVEDATLKIDGRDSGTFTGNSMVTALDLSKQHSMLIHKAGYEDLQFTILPASQEDRDKLKNLIINIDAHLMLQPLEIDTK